MHLNGIEGGIVICEGGGEVGACLQGSNFIRRSSRGRQVADSRLHSNEEHRLKEWNSNPSLSLPVVRPPPSSRRDKSSGLIERERLVMVFQGESLLSSRSLKRWYVTVNILLSLSRPVIPSSAEGV